MLVLKLPKFDQRYMAKRKHIAWRGPIIAKVIVEALGWCTDRSRTVLDLGCATGDIARGLWDHGGVEAYGVDNSPVAGELCRREYFVQADLTTDPGEWPWSCRVFDRDDAFLPVDLVILIEVLSIVSDDDRYEILRSATHCGRRLLINHLNAEDECDLLNAGWRKDFRETRRLRLGLEPWRDHQAMKAIHRTGEFWSHRKELV